MALALGVGALTIALLSGSGTPSAAKVGVLVVFLALALVTTWITLRSVGSDPAPPSPGSSADVTMPTATDEADPTVVDP